MIVINGNTVDGKHIENPNSGLNASGPDGSKIILNGVEWVMQDGKWLKILPASAK